MNPLKRKTPGWATPGGTASTSTSTPQAGPSPLNPYGYGASSSRLGMNSTPGTPGTPTPGMSISGVKRELGLGSGHEGPKRSRLGYEALDVAMDPRAAAINLEEELKSRGTMPLTDAYFFVQEDAPGVDAADVIEILKGRERVGYNIINQVLSYVPALTITSQTQLLTHIRLHTTPRQSLSVRDAAMREATKDQPLLDWLVDLEKSGEVLLVRSIGQFAHAEIPQLGRLNGLGMGIMDLEKGGSRVKSVFWDEVRGKGRAGKRVEDDLIHLWADVPLAETDDVGKLLAQHQLSASSNVPEPPKPIAATTKKKKKSSNRVLKITNTHMKALGVDFTKDYDPGAA